MRSILCIGGFDPINSAGITLDLIILKEYKIHAVSVLTSIVVQNSNGVISNEIIDKDITLKQFSSIIDDPSIYIDIIYISYITNIELVKSIKEYVKVNNKKIILDLVIYSTSGYLLIDDAVLDYILSNLLECIYCLILNIDELNYITHSYDLYNSLTKLNDYHISNIFIKSAYTFSNKVFDLLYENNRRRTLISNLKVYDTNKIHGTGSLLTSLIVSYLYRSYTLLNSIIYSKQIFYKFLSENYYDSNINVKYKSINYNKL